MLRSSISLGHCEHSFGPYMNFAALAFELMCKIADMF